MACPTNLQPQPTRFVGRAADLAGLTEAVGGARLVTLLGPPGVGKTRLAHRFAEAQAAAAGEAWPAGVWWCDVSSIADGAALAGLIRSRAGLPSPEGSGEATRLGLERPALVILDEALARAGIDRVYNAIATLRRMGLREALLRQDEGYLLDPATQLVLARGDLSGA